MKKSPLISLLTTLSSNAYLNGLCNTFVMLLPISLISAFSILISNLLNITGFTQAAEHILVASDIIWRLFPILLLVYYSLFLASLHKLSKVTVITPAMVIYFVICHNWGLLQVGTIVPSNYPLAIIIPTLVSLSIRFVSKRDWFVQSKLPSVVDQSINLVLSTFLLVLFYTSLAYALEWLVDFTHLSEWALPKLTLECLSHGVIYEVVRNLFWSVGINGHIVLAPYKAELYELTHNALQVSAQTGSEPPILTSNFYDIYAGMGGAGNTLSLVICMILLTKHKAYRSLGIAVLVLSIFNINEPVIFGLPIMFNPILIIPFLLVPVVGLVTAYYATLFGLVPPVSEIISWMSPPLWSGYIATGGHLSAALLQAIIILAGILIYYPFFRRMDQIANADTTLFKSASDDFFDYEALDNGKTAGALFPEMMEKFSAQQRVAKLKLNGDFVLFYQPQFDTDKQQINSVEVLIRHQDHLGKITPPYFLDDFRLLGLSSELDLWVVKTALCEVSPLASNPCFKVSINISPETCLVADFASRIINMIEESALDFHQVELEITEELLIQDAKQTQRVLDKLRGKGVQIALDDFGSGYSSIGYLSKFDFDKVKIDRSLVLNLDNHKGRELFRLTTEIVKTTGAEIVVEGVETKIELNFVSQLGIHLVQGYYFYKPMPFTQLIALTFEQDCLRAS
ncbi:EAL domain-containing protein [Vibrio vulnificus]|uniref:EAL domain-containing protein n=1 Tax=Vibrio vulnificus TaxID=672 RepID=UPI0019D4371E|nr:EAL domain-containing protein [Vibrio vulnificus]EHU9470750.1 PTS sugar transporter subunit IIC/EAL domain-containing protein [Vibrio vulnificus]MBN8032401.1 PTS sugar transporter subunit IIC/EAL domain-containing protein [Vibrio vulnificus]HDY7485711.1 PTS sugar transporter subunit IIC/EAL domain-containing protein [Vibrio vulnificus]HDY8059093.1 PTS sugar transporter subunit IIC/EAL domain-containing protein [Vibrio vulnificus]HDY8078293.1 PTS sugar transporter subunit IIC/EAL domain-cont